MPTEITITKEMIEETLDRTIDAVEWEGFCEAVWVAFGDCVMEWAESYEHYERAHAAATPLADKNLTR